MEAGMGRRDSVAQRNSLIPNVLYKNGSEKMAASRARHPMAKISKVSLKVAPPRLGAGILLSFQRFPAAAGYVQGFEGLFQGKENGDGSLF